MSTDLNDFFSEQMNLFKKAFPYSEITSTEVKKEEDGSYHLIIQGRIRTEALMNQLRSEGSVAIFDKSDTIVFKGSEKEAFDFLNPKKHDMPDYLVYDPKKNDSTSGEVFLIRYEVKYGLGNL